MEKKIHEQKERKKESVRLYTILSRYTVWTLLILSPTSCELVTSENINYERFFSAIGPQTAPSPTQSGFVAYSNPQPLGLP